LAPVPFALVPRRTLGFQVSSRRRAAHFAASHPSPTRDAASAVKAAVAISSLIIRNSLCIWKKLPRVRNLLGTWLRLHTVFLASLPLPALALNRHQHFLWLAPPCGLLVGSSSLVSAARRPRSAEAPHQVTTFCARPSSGDWLAGRFWLDEMRDVRIGPHCRLDAAAFHSRSAGRLEPDKFEDQLRTALVDLINQKRAGKSTSPRRNGRARNVVDLMERCGEGGGAAPRPRRREADQEAPQGAASQKEMLMPIEGKKPAKEATAKKTVSKPQRKSPSRSAGPGLTFFKWPKGVPMNHGREIATAAFTALAALAVWARMRCRQCGSTRPASIPGSESSPRSQRERHRRQSRRALMQTNYASATIAADRSQRSLACRSTNSSQAGPRPSSPAGAR